MSTPPSRVFQDRLCPRVAALRLAAVYLALVAIFLYNIPHHQLIPLVPLLLLLAYASAVLLLNLATHRLGPAGIATTHGPLPALSVQRAIPAADIHAFYFYSNGAFWSAGVRTNDGVAIDLLTRLESSEEALTLAHEFSSAVDPSLPVVELDPDSVAPPPQSYTQLLCWLGALGIALTAAVWLHSI